MFLNTKKIEFARKNLQIPQNELAEKIGITRFTYKKLLDNQDFRLNQLSKISEILEIPFFEIFENIPNNGNIKNNYVNVLNGLTENENDILNKLELKEQENKHLKDKVKLLEEMLNLYKSRSLLKFRIFIKISSDKLKKTAIESNIHKFKTSGFVSASASIQLVNYELYETNKANLLFSYEMEKNDLQSVRFACEDLIIFLIETIEAKNIYYKYDSFIVDESIYLTEKENCIEYDYDKGVI